MNPRAYYSRPIVRCTHPVFADAPAPVVHATSWWWSLDMSPTAKTVINPAARGGGR